MIAKNVMALVIRVERSVLECEDKLCDTHYPGEDPNDSRILGASGCRVSEKGMWISPTFSRVQKSRPWKRPSCCLRSWLVGCYGQHLVAPITAGAILVPAFNATVKGDSSPDFR
jgi:hypothetical protein